MSPFIWRHSCCFSVRDVEMKMNLIPGFIHPSASLCSAVIFHLRAKVTARLASSYFFNCASVCVERTRCLRPVSQRQCWTGPARRRDAYCFRERRKNGKPKLRPIISRVDTLQCCDALCLSCVDARFHSQHVDFGGPCVLWKCIFN